MSITSETTVGIWAWYILISASVFTLLWMLDARTHARLVKVDIGDKELQTHRNILLASFAMELSLVLMYWWPVYVLPLFIAAFLTRFVQESIDELKYHADRCTPYESLLHLGMWISVLTKAFAMFIWGFFCQYEGISDLPLYCYVWAALLFLLMSYVSFVEWKR